MQASVRRNASRQGEQLIDFLKYRVVIFFGFIFCSGWIVSQHELLSSSARNQGTIRRRRIHRSAASLGLTRGSSWTWRSRKAAVPAPNAFGVETSGDVIERVLRSLSKIVQRYFTGRVACWPAA